MNRFHVNVIVADLADSTRFYTTLFGCGPTVSKPDYAKWMLDDPRVNFSVSTGNRHGINHLGLQADTLDELGSIQSRLSEAGEHAVHQPDAECCYAKSTKTWVRDPDGVAWETFVTHGESTQYGTDDVPGFMEGDRCCAGDNGSSCCI